MALAVGNQDGIDDGAHHLINTRQSTCDSGCFGMCINRCTNCTLANCVVRGKLDLCRVGTVNGGNLALDNIIVHGDLISRSSGDNLFQIVFGNVSVNTFNATGNMNLHNINGRPSVYGGNLSIRNVTVDGNFTVGATVPEGNCPGTLSKVVDIMGGGSISCDKCPYGCGVDTVNGVLTVSCRLPLGCDCRAYCRNCSK
ncbi:unnamed protein product [Adineta steineri]|uniref:Uncharacterized protein n=1 Tax=Adineta steineri TaxID=433720 RepID=A0A815L9K4_9BILA|nr:unnamed protein product [Adineta steineri]CAF3891386.1 unnamed protein product [Adineta steineri]